MFFERAEPEPGSVMGTLHTLSHLIFIMIITGKYHLLFTGGEINVQFTMTQITQLVSRTTEV